MDIRGDILNPDDHARLKVWREAHAFSFAGFQQDAELALHGFRTAGDVLFLSPAYYQQLFGDAGPPIDGPLTDHK
jgi:hypothetical protein